MKKLYPILPWLFLALFAVEMVVVMLPRKEGEMHTSEFGRLPVLLNGRIQPFDSVARNSLLQIRSTGEVPLEEVPSWQFWRHPQKLRSTEWLLEVFFKPEIADTRPIFLIHHPDILAEFKLEEKGVEKSGLRYYSFQQIEDAADAILDRGRVASKVESARRSTYERQIIKLSNAVFLYHQLKNSIQAEGAHNFPELLAAYRQALPAGLAAVKAHQGGGVADDPALKRLASIGASFERVARLAVPLVVPPVDPTEKDGWLNVGASVLGALRGGEIHPAVDYFARMSGAYTHNNAAEFNAAVAEYRAWLEEHFPLEAGKGRAEFYYNRIKAFLHATIIYIAAFVLAGGALLTFGLSPGLSESLRKSAYYLIGLAFVVHTFGLVFRMMLEGRPPVTNLYSSAIFIGWGACILGWVLERTYRIGLGSAVAGLAGFVTLLIAHNLALGGDTMEMLRAVLDTNFWLATHVVVITLGYSATFVAGALGMAYVVLGVCTPLLAVNVGGTRDLTLGKALTKMVYAIICFATLFSFVGTVLGGIWADQSWGRFWGWDPKENGALLIVIWNALILHARWGGIVRERGLMNLAIFGNIVTAFSWFGTNMLGIGLHSYGFMDAGFKWLMFFNATQLLLIIFGVMPLRLWRSAPAEKAQA
jgi:ABC-type transport system involved in cytochrome c biogenesis permease subunit